MENSNIPIFRFPPLEIAELKDSILKYLSENSNQPVHSEVLYDTLKPNSLLLADYNEYIKEMAQEGVIITDEMSGNRTLLRITDKGRKFLRFGGYSADVKNDLNEGFEKLLEEEKRKEKLDLEINNLRASISHFKSTRKISIWAIIISITSLIASILFKIF